MKQITPVSGNISAIYPEPSKMASHCLLHANRFSDLARLQCFLVFQISDYSERRRGRKPKVDPAFLDVDKLTGEENVSVINRLTGKKVKH